VDASGKVVLFVILTKRVRRTATVAKSAVPRISRLFTVSSRRAGCSCGPGVCAWSDVAGYTGRDEAGARDDDGYAAAVVVAVRARAISIHAAPDRRRMAAGRENGKK